MIADPDVTMSACSTNRCATQAARRDAAMNGERPAGLSVGAARASLHVAVALFGLAALFGKWVALPPTQIVLARTLIAAATLAAVIVVRRQGLGRPAVRALVNGAILAAHWVAFFMAVRISGVAIALLGYATFPLFVLLLERWPQPSARGYSGWATALLAVLGMVALVPDLGWSDAGLGGLALGIVSAITFALLAVGNRALVEQMPPTRIAFWQNTFAAACLAPIVAVDRTLAWPGAADVVLLLVLGVVCTGLAHTLFIASMQRVSARVASVVAALEPVYGIGFAVVLLHEIPSARTLIGGGLIVAAALVASRRIA
jgi:drug/metabolite transporter (DMT)-like permease